MSSLSAENGVLRLTIDDNGCGFDGSTSIASDGLGSCRNARETYLIGGEIEIESITEAGRRFLREYHSSGKSVDVSKRTRIVLADDHPIVLNGLRNLVMAEDDLNLVGEASDGAAALGLIRETRPDVAVIDISMPGLNGIVLTRRLAQEIPSVGVLVLTLHEDRAFVRQAFEAGARGYVLKRSAAECLVQAIRAVVVGGTMSIRQLPVECSMLLQRGLDPGIVSWT